MGEIETDAAEVVPGAIENKLNVMSVEEIAILDIEAISFGEIARLDIIAEDIFGSQLEFYSNNFDPFKVYSCI